MEYLTVNCHQRSIKFVFGPIMYRHGANIAEIPEPYRFEDFFKEKDTWLAILAKFDNIVTWEELVAARFKIRLKVVEGNNVGKCYYPMN